MPTLKFAGAVSAIVLHIFAPMAAAAQDDKIINNGRALADKLCARCHAVGATGESKLAKAPPFRVIANRYSVWTLQEALAEGLVTGHAQMPEFVLNPDEINNLLTFMDTLTTNKGKPK